MKYLQWLLRIVAWDGLLPVCVAIMPLVVKLVFPHVRGAVEITAVLLPISAFFLRAAIGRQQIAAARSAGILRSIQYLAFGVALFLLALVECVFILSLIMPAGALLAKGDQVVWVSLFLVYFGSMAFAFFPASNVEAPSL